MPVSTSARPLVDPFQGWLDRCRAALGERLTAGDSVDALAALAGEMPRAFMRAQRESAQCLLTRLLCRAAGSRPLSAGVTARLLDLLADDFDERWRAEWATLVGVVLQSGQAPRLTAGSPTADARVRRALEEIERRYAEPDFTLQHVARELALSACRLTQLLKTATGSTFGAHVQRRRIAQACALLDERSLSIKQIAGRVGYQTPTQLGRQFKRHTSLSPSLYRRSLDRSPQLATPLPLPRAPAIRLRSVALPADHGCACLAPDTFADETTELPSDRRSRRVAVL